MSVYDEITWTCFNRCPSRTQTVAHVFHHYSLNFIEGGRLSFQLDDDPPVNVPGPVAWWMCPGRHYRYQGEHLGHRFVSFIGPAAEYLVAGGIVDAARRPPVQPILNAQRFVATMDELINYLASPLYGNARATQLLADLFLQLGEQRVRLTPSSPLEETVRQLLEAVRADCLADWDFELESRKAHVSYSYFRKLFKAFGGDSPARHLARLRLEWAAAQLRDDRMAIKEIAAAAGFDNVHYFTRAFHERFAAPPGEYRERFMAQR